MDFNYYINNETTTINNFFNQTPNIKLNKIINEGYSPYDAVITSGTTNGNIYGIVEAKKRTISSTLYSEGVLLELNKLQRVQTELNKGKNNPNNVNKVLKSFYLVEYSDVTFLFDLQNVKLGNIINKKFPNYTAKTTDNKHIYKDVFFLDPKQAIITIPTK